MKSEKPKKPHASKYDEKLAINGTFGQVIRVAVGKKEEVRKEREQAEPKK